MTTPPWHQLRNALAQRRFDEAAAMLAACPALRTQRNRAGETVLHFMAIEDDITAVRWLHSRGFELDTVNDFGQPLVFEVAQLGHTRLLLWLAQAGADMAATDGDGQGIVAFLREVLHDDMLAFVREHRAELGLPESAFGPRERHGVCA